MNKVFKQISEEKRAQSSSNDIHEIGLKPVYKDRKQKIKEHILFADSKIEFKGVSDEKLNHFYLD